MAGGLPQPPQYRVGYTDDGVILYKSDESGHPHVIALMSPEGALAYARDLIILSGHLARAADDWVAHRALVADIDTIDGGGE